MSTVIKSIISESPASKTIITPGDRLCRINNAVINDVLDYEFYSYDSKLIVELTTANGKIKLVTITKTEGADIGLEFESYLMDKERSCKNKCVFCFIDQLPKGMRSTLYYKDDDVRLSFLQGNYVTLTNLSKVDIERIIKLRISPINVSIHTLDPKLRAYMLGCGGLGSDTSAFDSKSRKFSRRAKMGIDALRAFAKAKITLNCQIVCCPGLNDGWELSKTIEGLIGLGGSIGSVSIVPVGLTKHRQGLPELQPFDKQLALQTVKQVEHYGEKCLKQRGSRVFYCADELYMMAELDLPPNEFYEDYPQLENGVGMMRLFITEVESSLSESNSTQQTPSSLTIITGILAAPYLTNISKTISKKYDKINIEVFAIQNNFFGESITVSGLITGNDIISQLKGKSLGSKVLIPENMLRHTGISRGEKDDGVFLDDVTVSELSKTLGVPVVIVKQDGADLIRALLETGE